MAESNIEWTEKVWNPLTGCTRIGKGCVNCYAERMSKRLQAMNRPEYQNVVDAKGHWTGNINLLFDRLHEPILWKKSHRIFVNSMSDLFHEKVNAAFIQQVVQVMVTAYWHTFQVLTKRYSRPPYILKQEDVARNIWIGYSICNQSDADNAREHLRAVAAMGWHTWISYEPAIGPVDWSGYEFVQWMVCGGESGYGARPMHPNWARSTRDWCQKNQIPFFFKQWGEFVPHFGPGSSPELFGFQKIGKKKAGRLLDGQLHDEYPSN